MHQSLKAQAALFAVTAGVLVAGCGGSNPRVIAAHKIADALPDMIGPAKHYDVNVDGSAMSLARGHAHRVQIHGRDVELAPSLVVNKLEVDAHDVSFDREAHKVENASHVDVNATIGQLHLDQYLAAHKPIAGLIVQIRWSDLEASVPVSALGISTTVRVDGSLAPSASGADKLDFVPSGGDIGPVPIPHRLIDMAMNRINPVLDLSTMKFPVTISSTKAVNGVLVVEGTTTLGDKTEDDRRARP